MKISFVRLLFLGLSFLIILGFRVDTKFRWNISQSDPTLWLNFTGDSLTNIETIADEIMADINDIETAYIRLALYPSDPNNPGDPLPGDSAFTRAKAGARTITISIGNMTALGAIGQAKLEISEQGEIRACDIKFKASLKSEEPLNIKKTIAHEIGHCLGLAHPQDTNQSIMSYFDQSSTTYRPDDIMGLTFLYPANMEGVNYTESPSFGLSCDVK